MSRIFLDKLNKTHLPIKGFNIKTFNTTSCSGERKCCVHPYKNGRQDIEQEAQNNIFNPILSPTQTAFVESNAVVNILHGPRGEGKTAACIVALVAHAKKCGKQIRCAIIRDTHENIKKSTARSIEGFLPPSLHRFKDDYKDLTIFSEPPVLADLFGIDDPNALQKLQGPEYALVWLEEPAPMSDMANAGLSEDVFNAALIVCTRQEGTQPRLQVSMNPADQDHWTYNRFFVDPDIDPENPLIDKAVFAVPYGDNKHLREISRHATKSAYKNDAASYARYVEGKFVHLTRGTAVTPLYGSGNYTTKVPIEPAKGLEGFRAWDGWLNPVAILGQITTAGRPIFIDTVRGNNCDVRILINDKVRPLLNSPRWKNRCKSWRDVGDRTMMIPDQSNINESAARAIEAAFHTTFEGGPARWEHMKRGIDHAFATNIAGKTSFVVNMDNRWLDKALAGGWHYKVDNAGRVVSDKPEKRNEESHVGDAWANAINILMPIAAARTKREVIEKMHELTRARAAGYAVG